MPRPFRPLALVLPALLLGCSPVLADQVRPLGDALSAHAPDRYREDLASLSARLHLTDEIGAVGRPGPVMDLARLHLAHGMWAEAGSLLDALDRSALTAPDRSRWDRMRLLSALFDRTGADPDPEELIAGQDWPDAALFRALSATGSGPDLAEAADLIRSWPGPVRERALPRLLERAIGDENWPVVRALSAQVRTLPELAGSPADLYLQGAAAERGGLPEAALKAYEGAGEGSDFWAARARLAWAELALSSGLADPDVIREHLASARTRWRGGEIGLETLSRLFEVTREFGGALDALDLVAEIRDRHLDEAERIVPDEQAWALMERFYAEGARGDIAFGPFFEGHLRLFRSLATDPRYLDLALGLAEQLAERGAYRLAGEEYRRVLDTLKVQNESAHIRVPPERIDRVRLRLAELLLDSGKPGEAGALLSDPVREAAFSKRQEALRARAFHDLGDWERVLTTWVEEPDPAHLRHIAHAHHALAEWGASRRSHLDLLARGPEADPAVLDRLILASFRSGQIREDEGLIRSLAGAEVPRLLDALLSSDRPATAMRRSEIEAHISETSGLIRAAEAQIPEGAGEDG